MASLSAAELRKYDWRPAIFVKKLKEKSKFELLDGRKVTLKLMPGVEDVLYHGTMRELQELRFTDGKKNVYKLTDFLKNAEFGGKGPGGSTKKQDMQLASIRQQIQTLKEKKELASLRQQIDNAKVKERAATIKMRVGQKIYDIFDAATTPGTPKSDFHLLDINLKECVWISHKDGKTARDFQQWGGLSNKHEPEIFVHPETQQFIADLKGLFPTQMTPATTVVRFIKDPKLRAMAVYGNQYGKTTFNKQNVNIVLQGDIKLKKSGSSYYMDATNVHLNGEEMTGPYEPVFMAVYKGDRSDFGIGGARIGIAPIGSRKINEVI
jgi:hypothetical protein